MAKWGRYLRLSLLLHVAVISLLGVALQQKITTQEKETPVRVSLAPIGAGTAAIPSGGSGGGTVLPGQAQNGGSGISDTSSGASETLLEELLEAPAETGTSAAETAAPVGQIQSTAPAGNHSSQGTAPKGNGSGGTASGNAAGSPGKGAGSGAGGSGGNGSGGGGGNLSRGASLSGFAKIYPRSAWESGEEGSCVVQVDVSAGGTAAGVRLLSSTGYDRLDRAALRSASQASYIPARDSNGNPVAGQINIPVRYSLQDGPG